MNVPNPAHPMTTSKRGSQKWLKHVLFVLDQIISGVVVGPLTGACWSGIWSLFVKYIYPDYPDNAPLCSCIAVVVSNVGLVILAFLQTPLKKYFRCDSWLWWIFGYHSYTAVLFVLNVFHWLGLWTLLDYYTGINPISSWTTYAIGQGILFLFRCTKAALAPPMLVAMDTDQEFFTYSTRFHTPHQLSKGHALDVLFTVLVIHQLGVVCYWRGLWSVMDVYLYPGPENNTNSAYASLVIGYVLLAVLCLMQPLCNIAYQRTLLRGYHIAWRWALETAVFFVANIVGVAHWRGVWMICDAYILPNLDSGFQLELAIGLGVLSVMVCGQSVCLKGCPIDGEASAEDGCMCPNAYLRYFMKNRSKSSILIDTNKSSISVAWDEDINMVVSKNKNIISDRDTAMPTA